ncbi:MAG: hypothetical protein JW726_06900 [Anaerolineales bacterium]|nr:hypothetical protein [Anaerolineales bacterium]
MLTEKDLQELLSFHAHHPVLSVYLSTDPSQGNADAYRLRLRTMLKDIDLPEDILAVERYFGRDFDWSGKSVVIFSCTAEKFFRPFTLAIQVRDRVRIGNHPHVKPLADALDAYGGYGVVLMDKQGARLFSFHLGELREQEGVMGESVRHTKRGGASAVAGRRGGVAGQTNYTEEVTERNMREIAGFAAHFFAENGVRRVLIGGTDDNVSQFRTLLPKSWQSLIVGTFPMPMTASKEEVLSKAMQIGNEAESRQEMALLNKIVTSASKGKGGVVGLDETLKLVHDGRVQTLVIREGYRAPGYHCQGCGYVTAEALPVCSYCGAKFEEIPDAVELAVWKVMQDGGEVEVLQHGHQVKGFSDIGALLRY